MKKILLFLLLIFIALVPLFANGTDENLGESSSGSSKGGGNSGTLTPQTSTETVTGGGTQTTASTTSDGYSSDKSLAPQIKTLLNAGTATGMFVGFSDRSATDAEGLNPINELTLTLSEPNPTGDISSLTASGTFYVYWIVSNNTTTYNLKLSWTKDILGLTVTGDGETITSGSVIHTITKGTSETKSVECSIVTEDLLAKSYGAKYTIGFTVEAETTT